MKRALVTGASGGIGEAIVRTLTENGYTVVGGVFRNAGTPMDGATYVKADIRKSEGADFLVSEAIRRMGGVDLLVNNAGIAQTKLFTDITDEDWKEMTSSNLDSVFYMCRAVLPGMISRKSGKIINISSMWGEVGASCEVHYSAAKGGVIALTKALAKEVAPSGVTVNAVSPGAIKTKMLSEYTEEEMEAFRQEIPMERIGAPEDVARAVLYLSEKSGDYITGECIRVNGGCVI